MFGVVAMEVLLYGVIFEPSTYNYEKTALSEKDLKTSSSMGTIPVQGMLKMGS